MSRARPTAALPTAIGRVLREERLSQGLELAQVGDRIGRSKSYVADLEARPHRGLTLVRLELVAGALGLRASDVLRRAEATRVQVHPVFEAKELVAV